MGGQRQTKTLGTMSSAGLCMEEGDLLPRRSMFKRTFGQKKKEFTNAQVYFYLILFVALCTWPSLNITEEL